MELSRSHMLLSAAVIAAVAFVAGALWTGGRPTTASTSPPAMTYTCPMHPGYVSDRPGTAPCCGMRLVPISPDASRAVPKKLAPGSIRIPEGRRWAVAIRTAVVERTAAAYSLRAVGRVTPDERLVYRVNAAVDGWVRRIFGNNTSGTLVRKDEPLATYYNREFLTAQQSYLYSLNTLDRHKKAENQAQIDLTLAQVRQTQETLESLGMSRRQIDEIAVTRESVREITIRSPSEGFILARNITPGERFERGAELYRIADLSRIWVVADIFESDADYVRPGSPALVRYRGRSVQASASLAYPQFDRATRTLQVRIELDNANFALRPDMFVDVEFAVKMPSSLVVPAAAVLDTGRRKLAYVDRGEDWFEPREVETGRRFGDRVQIVRGLEPGDRIVVEGNFLVDSESRIAAGSVYGKHPAIDPVCAMEADPGSAAAASTYRGARYYFCSRHCKDEFDANPEKYASGKPARGLPDQAIVPGTSDRP